MIIWLCAGLAIVAALALAVRQWPHVSRLRHLRRHQHISATDVVYGRADGGVTAQPQRQKAPLIVGFFHPYCNAGGGGERVLWALVRLMHVYHPSVHTVVYTGDTDATPEQILRTAQDRFGIVLPGHVDFVFLRCRRFVEAERYPRLTMLGQAFGACVLGAEAFTQLVPDILFDTMGYAFAYPLMKVVGGSAIISYTHYPTISTDMLEIVMRREATFNNSPSIARSALLSKLKAMYYNVFAEAYGIAGRFADLVMVNSTWTRGHIDAIWDIPLRTHIVYPPCHTELLQRFALAGRTPHIISVAQFRPEKNHTLQLHAFHRYLTQLAPEDVTTQMILIGGCRNAEDRARVATLEELSSQLSISHRVKVVINASHGQLMEYLQSSLIGLHSMRNEHFGIGVVEYMAAGLVAIAHKSGGPLMDIIEGSMPRVGYLASTADEYAELFREILQLPAQEIMDLQVRARDKAKKFSDQNFDDSVINLLKTSMKI